MNEELPQIGSKEGKELVVPEIIFHELLLDMELQENYSRSLADGGTVEVKEFLSSLRKQMC
ncbi:MAG: hypothetical protein MJZ21_00085 [archaeon]|nr:hypothetical protein [archaeon]